MIHVLIKKGNTAIKPYNCLHVPSISLKNTEVFATMSLVLISQRAQNIVTISLMLISQRAHNIVIMSLVLISQRAHNIVTMYLVLISEGTTL